MSWWGETSGDPGFEQSEKELVTACHKLAQKMNVYLEVAGQRMARGSGTTVGFPDAFAYVSGKCLPIEFKTKEGRLSPGQALAQNKRADQNVRTWIVRSTKDFIALVNEARRTK